MRTFFIKAKRPRYDYEPETPRHWMDVGIATEQEDGNILLRLNALPFGFDADPVLKLVLEENRRKKSNND